MKKLLLPLICLCYISGLFAQTHSCCTMPVSQEFAAMVQDKAFIDAHASPLPFNYESKKGTMITFSAGTKNANAFEIKSDKPTNNIILLFHEWWGLNDYIKQEAEKLQAELGNVTVIAVDMFDGKVTADAQEAMKQVQGLTDERSREIVAGAIKYCGDKARISTIGWCFGGGISLQASIEAGKQGVACVMYYGMPEKNMDRIKKLQAPVLGIFATKDKFISPKLVNEFDGNMKIAGKKIIVKNYDADHAFANPSNPHHDAVATADAHKLTIACLKEKIGR